MKRPYQRPVPGPREVRAPDQSGEEGGGSGGRGSASAHTHKGHAGNSRRATGPSSRNAQTAWNGVPASEGKGHPDGTARHTQRGTRGAGRGKRGSLNKSRMTKHRGFHRFGWLPGPRSSGGTYGDSLVCFLHIALNSCIIPAGTSPGAWHLGLVTKDLCHVSLY